MIKITNQKVDTNYLKKIAISAVHTLKKVKWEYVLSEEKAIKTNEFEKPFGIYHPIQTSSRIRSDKAEDLLKLIKEKGEKVS